MEQRQIEFEVWDTEEKKWVGKEYLVDGMWLYKWFLYGYDDGEKKFPGVCNAGSTKYWREKQSHWVRKQYTGVKDSKGNKIFEGDIVRIDFGSNDPSIFEVYFDNGTFCLKGQKNVADLPDLGDNFVKNVEKIGNIFENPELLKKAEEE